MDINKLILKFIWKGKRDHIPNTIFQNEVGVLMLPNFKTYYKPTVINHCGIETKRGGNEQNNGTE